VSFVSFAEFEEHLREVRPRLDARYGYERSLASAGEEIQRDGTCAPCLRRTRFTTRTAGGEALGGGRLMPNWREQLTCDCEDRLSNRNRALLHFLAAEAGLRAWSRVLLFGPPGAADRRIAAAAASVASIPRLGFARGGAGARGYRLDAADAAFHLAVSADALHRVPPLAALLAELRRVLVPGGSFVFTVPFHFLAARSVAHLDGLPRVSGRLPTEAGGEVHALGWDILDRLRDAGFGNARAHAYWSDELGYLGSGNMIFSAVA
jgi:SAM-dependent methyltransferase